jgi:Xaa-Pro dipeptidase
MSVLSHIMETAELFASHLANLQDTMTQGLNSTCPNADGVLIHSGSIHHHFADDIAKPFRAWGHFLQWIPVDQPDQFLLFIPGKKPVYLVVIPQDFWHDSRIDMPEWWSQQFDIEILPSLDTLEEQIKRRTSQLASCVFLGEGCHIAESLSLPDHNINPKALLNWLDYARAYKSSYEISRIAEANASALAGHQAALDMFLMGGDEYEIHMAYLNACRVSDDELPYPSIVALNEHSATLHYQHKQKRHGKREPDANRVLLIDAGTRSHGYCSDITRTWVRPGSHPVFAALVKGVERIQHDIIASLEPGRSYIDYHHATHAKIAELLIETGVAKGQAQTLIEQGISYAFLPHGLGHHLGLQVHDTGGRLANAEGLITEPPPQYPALRNTRPIEANMVFTIEPGLYFIDSLLSNIRQGNRAELLNWPLVEALMPYGGIRIEDNIWAKPDGNMHNLTRRPIIGSLLFRPGVAA